MNSHVQTIKALGGYLQRRYPGMTLLSAFFFVNIVFHGLV